MEVGELMRAEDPGRKPLTVTQALIWGTDLLAENGVETARLDAELLLGASLGWTRARLLANSGDLLEAQAMERFRSLLERRAEGEPCAYLTGHREFWSLDFLVTPDVLVPRPETERLVEVALEWLKSDTGPYRPRILDLGTGSGAIAVALAKEHGDLEIYATDLSAAALETARANARRHGVERSIRWIQGDAFEPLRDLRGTFDAVVSNPPYVKRSLMAALPREVRREPRLALDGGADGTDLYRKIIPQGLLYLRNQGFLAMETAPELVPELSSLFQRCAGYDSVTVCRDDLGWDRVIAARKSSRGPKSEK